MRKLLAAVATLAVVAGLTSCTTVEVIRGCLSRPAVTHLDGVQPQFGKDPTVLLADDTTIDAHTASWTSDSAGAWPVYVAYADDASRTNLCFVGGSISTSFDPNLPWETTWHHTAGMVIETPRMRVVGTTFTNVGDAVTIADTHAQDFELTAITVNDAHDDCVEDDVMASGLISDSFLANCHSGISAHGWVGHTIDGRANTITLDHSLMHLVPHVAVFKGPVPGHGGFFKFADDPPTMGWSPSLVITNTIFRADQLPNYGTLGLPTYTDPDTGVLTPYPVTCSNNTMVWTGAGPFPADLPSCFTITTDVRVWDDAVADYLAAHTPP